MVLPSYEKNMQWRTFYVLMVLVSTAGLNDILRQIFLAGSKYETHFFLPVTIQINKILKYGFNRYDIIIMMIIEMYHNFSSENTIKK